MFYQEGPDWKPVPSIQAIEQAMREAKATKVWFRFQMTTTKETFNNTYCASKHDGKIDLWNEGEINRQNNRCDGSVWMRYFSFIFRKDKKMGAPCQYGVHYVCTEGRPPKLDFAFVQEKPYHAAELRDAGTKSSKFHLVLDIPHIRDACATATSTIIEVTVYADWARVTRVEGGQTSNPTATSTSTSD